MKIKQKGGIEYYSLPIGTKLYRGDSDPNIGDNLILDNRLTFFGFDQSNVEENYGVAYEFRTKNVLKLIALDKNRELDKNSKPKFLNIVKDKCGGDTDEYKTINRILDINYGFSNGIRDSVSANDKTISEFICKNFPEYHGYACEQMETDGKGIFHSESMICVPNEHLDGGRRVTKDAATIHKLRQEYKERKAQPDKKKKTKSRFYKDESSPPTGRGLFDETPPHSPSAGLFGTETPPHSPSAGLFGTETPPHSPGGGLFAGKRKTKKRNAKKRKPKSRKQSLRK